MSSNKVDLFNVIILEDEQHRESGADSVSAEIAGGEDHEAQVPQEAQAAHPQENYGGSPQ